MVGVLRWQGRIWSLVTALRVERQEVKSPGSVPESELKEWEDIIWEARNSTIKEVRNTLHILNFLEQSFILSSDKGLHL